MFIGAPASINIIQPSAALSGDFVDVAVQVWDQFNNIATSANGLSVKVVVNGSAVVLTSSSTAVLSPTGIVTITDTKAETVLVSLVDFYNTGLITTSAKMLTFAPGLLSLHQYPLDLIFVTNYAS
jgi:hypothetical protein